MYNKVDAKLNLQKVDKEMLEFWDKDDTFQKSITQRKGAKPFIYFDGPPGINGKPHIGHTLNRVFKDIVLRYKSMKGYYVERQAGWDAHGLPIELKAEKDLKIENKQELEKFGMERFIDECKKVLNVYDKEWEEVSKTIGFWVDLKNAYYTCDDNYIESVWWSLKEIYNKELLVKGYRVAPYCARCGTSLSEAEVAQGYEKVTDRTLYVKFKSKSQPNTYFIAWTTTPWTLPSNVALCVNEEFEYSTIKVDDMQYIMATALIGKLFTEYETVSTCKGKDLVGQEYEPLFKLPSKYYENEKGWYITSADYVTLTDGTGIVHIAPAFGEDDYKVGKEFKLPFVQLVDEAGIMKEDIAEYAGMKREEANTKIIDDLKASGKVVKEEKVSHDYPHCWRCHKPLMYYAREGWFIESSKFRKELVKNNNDINWYPESAKDGRMGNFLREERDWNLSRDRFWATPLNIWACPKCGKQISVGSKKELQELSGNYEDVELHRPYIDKITIPCECGAEMHRVPQVIDVWYDSGAMPFASLHYPFENKELFEQRKVADFIVEGQDQTRGWFHSLQVVNTLLFDRTPYRNCILTGIALDEKGVKQSKSVGNVTDTMEVCNKFGADVVRWFIASNALPWQNISFSDEGFMEVQHKIVGTLWNVYSFYVLYANIDNFEGGKLDLSKQKLTIMDRWILSELNSLIKNVTEKMDNFNWTQSSRDIEQFVDELSNWYVRRCRERFWVDGECEDKVVAFETLYQVLITLLKLVAPMMPFLSEYIYQNLTHNSGSIHLCDYPEVDNTMIDKALEQQMKEVVNIVNLARSVRAGTNIKTRQPLSRMLIHTTTKIEFTEEELSIIADDINVKEVEFIENPEEYLNFELKPQLKTLGPKYGARLGEIRVFLQNCDSAKVVSILQQGGSVQVSNDIELALDDVLIYTKSKDAFSADSSYGITVVLDTTLTPELIEEGHMREVISKLQNMRKDAGFDVEDKIEITYWADIELANVIENNKEEIAKVTVANKITKAENDAPEIDINGMKVKFSLKKVE